MRSLVVEGTHIVGLVAFAAHIDDVADMGVVDMAAADMAAAVDVAVVAVAVFHTILLVFAFPLHLPLSVLTTNQYSTALATAIWHFRTPMPPSSP